MDQELVMQDIWDAFKVFGGTWQMVRWEGSMESNFHEQRPLTMAGIIERVIENIDMEIAMDKVYSKHFNEILPTITPENTSDFGPTATAESFRKPVPLIKRRRRNTM